MTTGSTPFLLRFWWLPPLILVLIAMIAAWIYRERPFDLNSFPTSVLGSTADLEAELGAVPPQRIEYTAQLTTEVHGQRWEAKIRHVAEHVGNGWYRRSDFWHDEGSSKSTYQERYLTHRNFKQVFRQYREMAPIVHDLLDEYGWLTDAASSQQVTFSKGFPDEDGASLSSRQTRLAQTERNSVVLKPTPYERITECQRTGVVPGSSVGPGLSGDLTQVSCRLTRSDMAGEVENVFVWVPKAGIFLLVSSQQPTQFGGTEIQTRRIMSISVSP